MEWKDKFKYVLSILDSNSNIEQDFYIKGHSASSAFIASIIKRFPFVTEDYIEFLKFTDGADIAQVRFLEEANFSSLAREYGEIYMPNEWLPIAYEADGDPVLLKQSGEVVLGYGSSISGKYDLLADSFSGFLEEVIMGQNYSSIFRVSSHNQQDFYKSELSEDPWLEFLVNSGWLIIGKDRVV